MANTTVKGAHAIHGRNPQVSKIESKITIFLIRLKDLVENVIRNRIYESLYWKEHCFALTGIWNCQYNIHGGSSELAASLIDKAIELQSIGGVYGNQRPTEFLCLLLKLLQIQPEKEILIEYLQADEFKYVSIFPALRLWFFPV